MELEIIVLKQGLQVLVKLLLIFFFKTDFKKSTLQGPEHYLIHKKLMRSFCDSQVVPAKKLMP